MAIFYAPLRLRSNWSLARGGSTTREYLERAAHQGLPAVAFTDDNLFGSVAFFEEAKRFGIKPVLGASIRDERTEAVLLVKNENGYASLCRILTERDLEPKKGGFSLEQALLENPDGLILITADERLAGKVRDAFEKRLFLEASACARRGPSARDLPIVAAEETFFADRSGFATHRLLTAIRLGKTVETLVPPDLARPDAFLRSPADMAERFRHVPCALANSLAIAEQCPFDLLERETAFPRIAGEHGPRMLREHAFAGARERCGRGGRNGRGSRLPAEVLHRLETELETITRMGFADYFLVVEDIVRHARSLGTPTAGRGSGAGSLVAYTLKITNVDPVRYCLPFERFLNPGRTDYPDLDVDFCWRLRDEVIDYTFRRFGRDRTAMIATYATLQPRLAFRETAKALGLSNPVITQIARKLRYGISRKRFNTLPADAGVVEKALALSKSIEGFPHHLSVHCGGVVITPGPISSYAPLVRAQKGVVITAYDKRGVERAGLVKLDLLGNRSLSTVSEAVRLVGKSTGKSIDPEKLPVNGARAQKAFDLIRAGKTMGCGQLESPAMRHLLMQMRPDRVEEIMQALALIRPGASGLGMKELFVRRKRGMESAPRMPRPLEKVLGVTHGVMLYEDDAMLLAMEAAGFSAGDADRFRKAMTKGCDEKEKGAIKERFLAGCEKREIKRGAAQEIIAQIEKFKSYSFCRAHSASYALLAYASAWLRANHPPEYWTAALNNNEGMYPVWVLVEEAKRSGVDMLAPCVNRSGAEFAMDGGAVRSGLASIASLSTDTTKRILKARPFQSLEQLVARARPREEEAESLIRCGALDFTGIARNRLLWKVMTSHKRMRDCIVREPALGYGPVRRPGPAQGLPDPALPKLPESRLWKDEWEIMGFTCREHPLAAYREQLGRAGADMSSRISEVAGRFIRLAGVIAASRRVRTRNGKLMRFLTLDDEHGVFEAVLFPETYKRTRFALDSPGPYLVDGRVDDQYGALAVRAERIVGLGEEGKRW